MLALTFQIDNSRVALDVRQISLVVPRVPLERVAGAPPWLAGVFVYAQNVVPVIDLHRLLGAGDCPQQLSSRIILLPWPQAGGTEGSLGLLAAHVSEIHEITHSSVEPAGAVTRPELGPAIIDRGEITRLLDIDRLLTPSIREQLAGVCTA
ncbi:MAG TPA: chemotaxis protein CheW [Pirellulales bacterium]|jgi:chemotaxis-related protein WspB